MCSGIERRSIEQSMTPRLATISFERCVRGEGVQGVLTLICGGVARTCHDDRVVELKEQLGIEEVDGEGKKDQKRKNGDIESKRTRHG